LTSAPEGGEGSASRPGRKLPPGMTRYPLYRRLGGPQGRSGQVRKISPPPGFDHRTVQPVGTTEECSAVIITQKQICLDRCMAHLINYGQGQELSADYLITTRSVITPAGQGS